MKLSDIVSEKDLISSYQELNEKARKAYCERNAQTFIELDQIPTLESSTIMLIAGFDIKRAACIIGFMKILNNALSKIGGNQWKV